MYWKKIYVCHFFSPINMDVACNVDSFYLSNEEYSSIEQKKMHYENSSACSIEALKIVQKKRGWITDGSIYAISDVLGIPVSHVEGISTFYSNIFRKKIGRHVIRYCESIVCYINGYRKIQSAIEKKLKIKKGKTTNDNRFTLLSACCLGNCNKGPTMMINDDTYSDIKHENIPEIMEKYQ